MTEVDKQREATASIRGYMYQLDATLLEILKAGMDDEVIIEGIEDFDRYSKDAIIYSQVKYYAGQNLTDSVLRDPLYKLFTHFNGLNSSQRNGRKYVLYGHFAKVNISIDQLSVDRFKSIMTFNKTITNGGKKTKTTHSLLDDHSVSDETIQEFCISFEIIISEDYDKQRASVIESVRKAHGVSLLEAEGFYYPRAFDFIVSLAVNSDHLKRKTTRRNIQENLKGCQAIHQQWMLREKSATDYGRHIRELYFQSTNSAGIARFFVIEINKPSDSLIILDQLNEIAKKWSSAEVKRTQNSDRHAPFVMLRGATPELLSEVKNSLYESGIDFVDGYPYLGSPFRCEHLNTPQTSERKISLRFIDNIEHLEEAFRKVGRKRCNIYDFFLERPLDAPWIQSNGRTFSIPIEDISTIRKMI